MPDIVLVTMKTSDHHLFIVVSLTLSSRDHWYEQAVLVLHESYWEMGSHLSSIPARDGSCSLAHLSVGRNRPSFSVEEMLLTFQKSDIRSSMHIYPWISFRFLAGCVRRKSWISELIEMDLLTPRSSKLSFVNPFAIPPSLNVDTVVF